MTGSGAEHRGGSPAPQVSMIVPVYKVPEVYLRKCIESCMAQTLQEIEILLIDDGSPDECGGICDEYAGQDSRIRVIHKENGGLCSARNAGFLAARGNWVMFVDGDDWIDADMCRTMLEAGERENVDLVMCGIVREYGHSSQPYHFYLRDYASGGKVYREKECRWLQQQLLVYNGNIAVAYSKLIRRSILEDHQILHDEALRQGAEGLEFNIRLFEKIRSALFLNRPFYHYIYNEESISSSHSEENHAYVIRCFEKIRDLIEESENRDRLLPWFDNRLLYVIITTAISGYFNPDNPAPFSEKKRGYAAYLRQPIVEKALRTKNLRGLSRQRRFVLFLIRTRQFRALDVMGRARKWQKGHM
ncbi:MAG: glycosyltransferase family 2 protein [Lachnospiraceae bacterium]|nr:glycosyltransferase family 2 protein [Sarcina sp.]MBR2729319.1 glycosyltransferase family 2 protein [Lachnospiraceae bacterium]